ncbi:MAG: FmdB family zinc ribbon protein [Fimbriimonas sp.]
MPTYVYECSSCNSTFEAEQRIIEDPLDSCRCGSKGTVKRLIQPIAVMFKGSGFHINDYSAKAAESKAETKTEAAPTTAEHATPPAAPAPAAAATAD